MPQILSMNSNQNIKYIKEYINQANFDKNVRLLLGRNFVDLKRTNTEQIRPSLEYGSHLWRGASKHSLATLDAIQKRAI